MGIIQWAERRTKALTFWDIGFLKVYCVLFGMIVGAYIPTTVRAHVGWFVAAVLVFGGSVGYRFLTAEPR
jgi:hypothetical protein